MTVGLIHTNTSILCFINKKKQVFGRNMGEMLEVLDEMLEVLEVYHYF